MTREQLADWSDADEHVIRSSVGGIMQAVRDCDEVLDDNGWCSCARLILFTLRDALIHDRLRATGPVQADDTRRLDWLEQWLKSDEPTRHVEAWRNGKDDIWLFAMGDIPDSYGPRTIAEAPTIRAAIDAAMQGAVAAGDDAREDPS